MNRQFKNLTLVMIAMLLLAACGRSGTTLGPAEIPERPVTENPTGISEPVVIPAPSEGIPTAGPSDGLAPQSLSQYIGLRYPPFPAGLSQDFSMMIQDSNDHGLSLVVDGENKMLWLSKIIQYDANGVAYWEVTDVLDLSNLETGLTLVPDGCRLNGVPESEIFVARRNGVVLFAWRANTSLGRFEAMPLAGIQCNTDKAVHIT
jgi:hypothetical protein